MEQMEKKVNSVGLYDRVSIETWLKIAEGIQKFEITDGNDKEFAENLKKLQNILVGTEVSLKEKERYATFFLRVGLATLLQSIYEIKNEDKKKQFAEQINALYDLGIRTVQFSGKTSKICGIQNIYESTAYPEKDVLLFSKCLTDGSFSIGNVGGYSHMFEMTDVDNFNYFLHIILSYKKSKDFEIKVLSNEANAHLMTFDGLLPSKEEVMASRQPNLWDSNFNIYEWQVMNGVRVKEHFDPYVRKRSL